MTAKQCLWNVRIALWWLVPLLLVGSGCGRTPKLVPVGGTVMLDGKALAGASVFLVPDGTTGRDAYGVSGPDGTFTMGTVSCAGVSPGTYRVMVGSVHPQHSGGNPADEERAARRTAKMPMTAGGRTIPPIYSNPTTTPLRCTIPMQGQLVLQLQTSGR